jgi:hypothetical protein
MFEFDAGLVEPGEQTILGRSLHIMEKDKPKIFRAEEPKYETPKVLVEGSECGDDAVGSQDPH